MAKKNQKFAIIENGGNQHRVEEGQVFSTEINPDINNGDKVTFDNVLLLHDSKDTLVGDPYLKGKKVSGKVVEKGKENKINVLRFRSKSRHRKVKGHRQNKMKVLVEKIA